MQMCDSIALMVGIHEERIQVNSSTKFAVNLMNNEHLFTLKKIKLLSRLQGKPSRAENWCVNRLIIIAVPFDGLISNNVTATKS